MMRRRLSRRSQLVWARNRSKNQIHAVLVRQLLGRPPFSDVFGVKGRQWLSGLQLPPEESETVSAAMRQIEFLDSEISEIERLISQAALESGEIKRRFKSPRKLGGYLGLDPLVRQSGVGPATHGHISKRGSTRARHALVEACWTTVRQPGPLHAFYQRIRARRGHSVAIVAAAAVPPPERRCSSSTISRRYCSCN